MHANNQRQQKHPRDLLRKNKEIIPASHTHTQLLIKCNASPCYRPLLWGVHRETQRSFCSYWSLLFTQLIHCTTLWNMGAYVWSLTKLMLDAWKYEYGVKCVDSVSGFHFKLTLFALPTKTVVTQEACLSSKAERESPHLGHSQSVGFYKSTVPTVVNESALELTVLHDSLPIPGTWYECA